MRTSRIQAWYQNRKKHLILDQFSNSPWTGRFTNLIVPRTRDRYLLEEETSERLTEADQSSQVVVSKARKHTLRVCAACSLALPVQH
jgi:hypothetical protein